MPGRRAHHAATSASRRASGSCARARTRLPGLRDRLQRATSTTIRATTRPTATARATTRRSTSTGCATRACSRTSAAHDGRVIEATRRAARRRRRRQALEAAKKLFDGVAEGVESPSCSRAQHSNEDNWALRELARAPRRDHALLRGGRRRRATRTTSSSTRTRTRTPRACSSSRPPRSRSPQLLDDVARRPRSRTSSRSAAPTPRDAGRRDCARHARTLVTIAVARRAARPRRRHVVLPATSWAEQPGTYVNAQGHAPGRARRRSSRRARRKPGVAAARRDARRRARLRADVDEAEGDPRAAHRGRGGRAVARGARIELGAPTPARSDIDDR